MQKNLLDTHTFIWFINGDKKLSSVARTAIEKEDATNYFSIASIWEMAIKISLGKLELNTPFAEIKNQLSENSFELLHAEIEDALIVAGLPFHHTDPFDRLIIAQAMRNDMFLISKDEHFESHEVKLIW